MTDSTTLDLVPAGTLQRPGPIGRLVRAVLGIGCLYVVGEQIADWASTAPAPIATLPSRILVLAAPSPNSQAA